MSQKAGDTLVGAQYVASPATLSDGQSTALLTDATGNLKVVASGTPAGTQDVNVKQINGNTVSAGSGATGTGSQRVTVAIDAATVAGTAPVSNASSTVATSAVNAPTVSYLYGWNGSTWDQLNTTTPAQTFVSNSFLNVAAGTATTTAKNGAGTFASVVINTVGVANTLTIYDSLAGSGTKIATINTAAAIAGVPFTFNVAVATGITLVSAGGTGADYTVTFR